MSTNARALTTLVTAGVLGFIWMQWGIGWVVAVILVLCVGWAFYVGFYVAGPDTPTAIARIPTRHEQRRRWRIGIGLGVGRWGPFPFITLYRRQR